MPTFEFSIFNCQFSIFIVRLTGLEPARRETLDPKSSASTNSATGAHVLSFGLQRYNLFVNPANNFSFFSAFYSICFDVSKQFFIFAL